MPNPFSHIAHAVLTDVGRKRKNNEDAYAVFPEHGFFCVADGMGGAEDGEVASGAVADGLTKLFERFDAARPLSLHAKTMWIAHALNEASNWIYQRSQQRGKSGTGTTFVGIALDPASPGSALALHAGDSRVYRLANGKGGEGKTGQALEQVTVDHSVANSIGMDDERRLNPLFRNMIMRAVGLASTVQVERTPFAIDVGDWVIVCSDGLSRMVSDPDIAEILSASPDPDAAARSLVDAALAAGGKDNVTVVAVRIGEGAESVAEDELDQTLPFLQSASGTSGTETTSDTAITEDIDSPHVHTERIEPSDQGVSRAWFWIAVAVIGAALLLAVGIALLGKTGAGDVSPRRENLESDGYGHAPKPERSPSQGSRIFENDKANASRQDGKQPDAQ